MMELQTDEPVGAAARTVAARVRRRLAGAVGIAAILGLTIGGATVAAGAPSPAPAPAVAGTVAVGGWPAAEIPPADVEKLDAAFAKYRACMQEHGVEMPEPVLVEAGDPGPGLQPIAGTGIVADAEPMQGFDAGAFEAANDACAPILEAAGIMQGASGSASGQLGPLGPGTTGAGVVGGVGVIGGGAASVGDVASMVAPIRKYAACMREHGVEVPDPVVDDKAGTFEMRFDADPTTTAFREANAACADGWGFGFGVPALPAGP